MAKTYHYTVRGRWPFPMDMLRKNGSEPANLDDLDAVHQMSAESAPHFDDVEIELKGPSMPVVERWNSFDWIVVNIVELSGSMRRSTHVHPPVEKQSVRRRVGNIDVMPTWRSAMPILIAALEDGTPEGKRMAREELMSLAADLDKLNMPRKEAA